MFHKGALAFLDRDGTYVVRSDQRANTRLVRPLLVQAVQGSGGGGGTGGNDCSNDASSCNVGDTCDGMPLIAVTSSSAGSSSVYSGGDGGSTKFATSWTFEGAPVIYGPTHQIPTIDWTCIAGAGMSLAAAASGIYKQISDNLSEYERVKSQSCCKFGSRRLSGYAALVFSLVG